MRLALKFFLAFSLVILVLAGIAGWSLREVSKLSIADPVMPELTDADALTAAASLREAVLVAKRVDMRSLVFSDAEYAAASNAAADHIRKELGQLRELVTTDEQKALVARALSHFDDYNATVNKARALRNGGDPKPAETMLRKAGEPLIDAVVEDMDALAALTRGVLERKQAEASAALAKARGEIENLRNRTWRAVITAMILAVLAALAGTAVIAVRMTRSLRRLSNATRALAEGRFDEPLPVDRRDEVGQLAAAFNTMAQRLRELDETKEKFYATVSHELRSPLNAMQEAVRLIGSKGAGPLTGKQERLIAILQKGTARLQRLVNQVLDLSRMSADTLPVERREFAIEHAVKQALDELKPQADRQRIALRTEIGADAGIVAADYDRVVEILLNLVANALRFTPSGGTVTVKLAGDPQNVRLEVSDTGIGIPEELLPSIFERFRQAHSGKGGTGLGLAIVKSLVEAHGGQVTAESQEGKGSTFIVVLPRGIAEQAPETQAAA